MLVLHRYNALSLQLSVDELTIGTNRLHQKAAYEYDLPAMFSRRCKRLAEGVQAASSLGMKYVCIGLAKKAMNRTLA